MAQQTDLEEQRDQPQPFLPPKIDKIAALVANNGSIHVAEEKAQKAASDLGNLYKKIETDFHGNRKAVKLIRTLVGGTLDQAHDFMRSFLHLAAHFNLMPPADLVDIAEKVKDRDPEDPGVSAADMAPKGKARPALTVVGDNAIDRAKKALQNGGKPDIPAPKGPPGDFDLADAGSDVADDIARQREEDRVAFEASEAAKGKPE